MNGLRKAFHEGENSSNCFHIRQHYNIYKEKCEKEKILMNHWATPPSIVKATKGKERKGKKRTWQGQGQGQQGVTAQLPQLPFFPILYR